MDAKKAYRKAVNLICRTQWVISSIIDEKGWPDNAIRTNFACTARFPALAKKLNHKTLENYFPINSYSSRLGDITACPKTALYYFDVTTKEVCQVQGLIRVVKDEKTRRLFWQQDWNRQCPDGVDGDEYTLLRFEGANLKYYDGVADSYWGPIEATSQEK